MNSTQMVKGGKYKHYKGKFYHVIDIVRHSETLEELVLYECLYENDLGKLWVRPKAMFFEKLEDGTPRFEYIKEDQGLIMADKKRCKWASTNELFFKYHDKEWGVPVHSDRKLFEMLTLETELRSIQDHACHKGCNK